MLLNLEGYLLSTSNSLPYGIEEDPDVLFGGEQPL
jgi:hypothetical protein